MASATTITTELMTALGILNFDPRATLGFRPAELRGVREQEWQQLLDALHSGTVDQLAQAAFENGRHFAAAHDALRGRPAALVEWTGPTRPPGEEVAPIDLRIDHVYLVSCKYLSKITYNGSPHHVIERLLTGPQGQRSTDWYQQVAPEAYSDLWRSSQEYLGRATDQQWPSGLDKESRKSTAYSLRGARWPEELQAAYQALCKQVSERSAELWRQRIQAGGARAAEGLLWRLLRIGSAPYFVLGAHSNAEHLRLRVASPWDWRQEYSLKSFQIAAGEVGQPQVNYLAEVQHRGSGELTGIGGHIEIRWSHGRFGGNPEAKVYLDTSFLNCPGFWPLR